MERAGPAIATTPKRVRWHRRPWAQRFIASMIAFYIRLVDRTGRWQVRVSPKTAALIRAGNPFIGAFWHGRLLMIYPAWRRLLAELGESRGRQPYVISSTHNDGQLIEIATSRFGLKTIKGSSRRGGVRVLREAERVLAEGGIVVITPDGPRGPRMRAHPGVAHLAGKTGVPVVPITFATRHHRLIKSWDRFMLVWPFASGVLAFGDPLALSVDDDTESKRRLIEGRMIAFAEATDLAQGVLPVEPEAPRIRTAQTASGA